MPLGPIDAVRPWTYGLYNQTSTRQPGEGPPEAAPQDPTAPQATNQMDCARAVSASPGGDRPDGGKSREQSDFLKREGQDQQSAMLAELTREEQAQVQKLRDRDREVRAHEQAHIAAGGQYVRGGASFDYQKGPDGRQYAVGGEVSIDASPAEDPQATIQKARTIKRAALAPAQPSSQDRKVAAKASRMETKARAEMTEEKQEKLKEADEEKEGEGAVAEGEANATETGSGEIDPEATGMEPVAGQSDLNGIAVEGTAALKKDQPAETGPRGEGPESTGVGGIVRSKVWAKSPSPEPQSYDRSGHGTSAPQAAERLNKFSVYI